MRMAVVSIVVSLAVFTLLSIALQVEAATITAASCSQGDVGNAVTAASDGDIVQVPAGTCSWTSTLTITKGITLQGVGIDQTVILDSLVPHTSAMLIWNVAAPKSWRLTGMTIKQGAGTEVNFVGTLLILGDSPAMRIDHVKFQDLIGIFIKPAGWAFGVWDHNQFVMNAGGPIFVHFSNGGSWKGIGQYGDNSWATPTNYGSSEFIFLEDNVFTSSSHAGFDADSGARFVFRNNKFNNTTIETHGTESTQRWRGFRVAEIYNNAFSDVPASARQAIHFRSGTGVIWGNTTLGYCCGGDLLHTDNYRDVWNTTPWGQCTGSSPWDQNQSGTSGYACLDQVGRGQGVLLSGDAPLPSGWPQQAVDPVYLWSNSGDFSYQHRSGSSKIQEGREVFLNTPKPGYTPYTYPHPLVVGGSSVGPSLPTGVTAR